MELAKIIEMILGDKDTNSGGIVSKNVLVSILYTL